MAPYAVTHSGVGHPDDGFAWVMIKKLFPNLELKRSRDQNIIRDAFIAFDVGGIYDLNSRRFDHHQRSFKEKRSNGIPYSSFGLIWKHFASDLNLSRDEIKKIDEILVQPVDAVDNGYYIDNLNWGVGSAINAFNPNWNDDVQDFDKCFNDITQVCEFILNYTIENINNIESTEDLNNRILNLPLIQQTMKNRENATLEAFEIVKKAIESKTDNKIIELDQFVPWQEYVIEHDSEAEFVIFRDPNDEWRLQTIPVEKDSFTARKNLPAIWGGKPQEQLNEILSINDAVFCHRQLFIAGAKSKESILKMAEIAKND